MGTTVPVPFFGGEGFDRASTGRLLLVSYCFPPDTTVGALRWQKFTRYAKEWEWDMDVITLDPASVRNSDQSRLAELPVGTRVFGIQAPTLAVKRLEDFASRVVRALRGRKNSGVTPSTGQSSVSSRGANLGKRRPNSIACEDLSWIPRSSREALRAYFAWSDYAYYRHWARDAARCGAALQKLQHYDAVITSGPPHMTHDAGRQLSAATGLPFVMDLRDPWSAVQRLPEAVASPVALRLARLHERRSVEQATLIVANTPALRRELERLYPRAEKRMINVRNGCDEDVFPSSHHGSTFIIGFAGTVYFDRDPQMLMRALAKVAADLHLTPENIRLDLVGSFDSAGGTPVREIAEREGVGAFVRVGAARPHREALEFFATATMLVTFPGGNSRFTIPAKTFEYVRFDAWILALSEPGSPTEQLLTGTDADVVAPEDIDAIAAAIRKRYEQFRRGERPIALAASGRFSRREQAEILFSALSTRIKREKPAPAREGRR